MSRPAILFGFLAAITALAATVIVVFITTSKVSTSTVTTEQRAVRERFFGSGDELQPIKKGQEMRPKW